MKLSNYFSSAYNNVDIQDLDIVELAPASRNDDARPEELDHRAINFNHIIETGRATLLGVPGEQPHPNDVHFNLDADDAFTSAMARIQDAVYTRIENSETLQDLLEKDSWDREDRVTWEREVSAIVNEEVDKIPGLGTYRSEYEGLEVEKPEIRSSNLNDLSHDIENGTTRYEFDCEAMSIIEGITLQNADNHFLPAQAADDNFKVQSSYFNVTSRNFDLADDTGQSVNHVFIVSSATGNIIEATDDPDAENSRPHYKEHVDPDYTFEDMLNGRPFLSRDHYAYAKYGHKFDKLHDTHIETLNEQIGQDAALFYDLVDTQWADPGHLNTAGQALPRDGDSLNVGQLSDVPPELRALAELKQHIETLEERLDTTGPAKPGESEQQELESRVQDLRDEFDENARSLIRNWGEEGVVSAIMEVRGQESLLERADALRDKIADMFPHNSEAQIDSYIQHMKNGTLPDGNGGCLDPQSEGALESFLDMRKRELFEERFPDTDYDMAQSIDENKHESEHFNSLDAETRFYELAEELQYGVIAPDDPALQDEIGMAAKYHSIDMAIDWKYGYVDKGLESHVEWMEHIYNSHFLPHEARQERLELKQDIEDGLGLRRYAPGGPDVLAQ